LVAAGRAIDDGSTWRGTHDLVLEPTGTLKERYMARSRSVEPPSKRRSGRLSTSDLDRLVEEAIVDAYGESEQAVGFYTMLEEHLAVPFATRVLGAEVVVEGIDLTDDERIVAVCRRRRSRQRIGILELPMPNPAPDGAEWIDAYRRWSRGVAGREDD
jgi:hypothetical protein